MLPQAGEAYPLEQVWAWRDRYTIVVSSFHRLLFLIPLAIARMAAQPPAGADADMPVPQAQALVDRALANEARAAEDANHPMRYRLRKSTPRLISTKEICETRDGDVARLIAINDQPLSPASEQQEQARLDALLDDPSKQRHRKQAEDADSARALKVLRALPAAFVYQYTGSGEGPTGKVEKFVFRPNPSFSPPDIETQALVAMSGEIWIDPARQRVARLEGRLERDVDFGWGILGRLNKGGWISIDQADVGGGQWRAVRFQMQMSGRLVWRTRVFDTTEEQTKFVPLPAGLGYRKAIEIMRGQAK